MALENAFETVCAKGSKTMKVVVITNKLGRPWVDQGGSRGCWSSSLCSWLAIVLPTAPSPCKSLLISLGKESGADSGDLWYVGSERGDSLDSPAARSMPQRTRMRWRRRGPGKRQFAQSRPASWWQVQVRSQGLRLPMTAFLPSPLTLSRAAKAEFCAPVSVRTH